MTTPNPTQSTDKVAVPTNIKQLKTRIEEIRILCHNISNAMEVIEANHKDDAILQELRVTLEYNSQNYLTLLDTFITEIKRLSAT